VSADQAPHVPVKDITAHLRSHPFGLEEGVHAQPVERRQQSLRFDREPVLILTVAAEQGRDHLSDDGGHLAVAAVGFGREHGPDPGRVFEGHPYARIHGTVFVKGQEFTQQG
jgi:hypothetical protein